MTNLLANYLDGQDALLAFFLAVEKLFWSIYTSVIFRIDILLESSSHWKIGMKISSTKVEKKTIFDKNKFIAMVYRKKCDILSIQKKNK